MPTHEELIAKANSTLNRLNLLLDNRQAETIITGDENTPLPTLDDDNNWNCTQDTADNGIYAGNYKLLLETGCVFVQSVTVVSHTTPIDNVAARYQACGSSTWLDLADVEDLDRLELQAFEIRSGTAFEVSVRLSPFKVTTGTEDDGHYITAAGSSGSRLDGVSGNANRRVLVLTFAMPRSSVTFNYSTDGAGDDMFARLGSGSTVTLPASSSGPATATAPVASTTLEVHLGYSGSSLYPDNDAYIYNLIL